MSNARNLAALKPNTSGLIEADDIASGAIVSSLGYDPTTMVSPKWTLHGSNYNEAGLTANRRIVLGTCYLPQGGSDVKITLFIGEGYNAAKEQYDEYVIRFRTSNGSSNAAGSSGAFYGNGWVEHFKYGTGDVIQTVFVEQIDTQNFRFSFDPSTLIGYYSHYEVTSWNTGVWTHSGTVVDGSPTVNYLTLSPTEIRSGGVKTAPLQPAFEAYNNTTQTVSNADADLSFNTTRLNVGGNYNTSNSTFTAPIAGTYLFGFAGTVWSPNSSDNYMTVYFKKNGSPFGLRGRAATSGGYNFDSPAVTMTMGLNAGDYVSLVGYCSNSNNMNIHGGEAGFFGYLIG